MSKKDPAKKTSKAPEDSKSKGAVYNKLTPEIIEDILARVSSGLSVKSSLEKHNIHYQTWYRWTDANSEIYARARLDCAHSNADMIQEAAEKIATGEYDPQQGRAIVEARKWTAGKLHFKVYGDRQQVDNTHKLEGMSDDELDERIKRLLGQ